jgi:hypothetical protein
MRGSATIPAGVVPGLTDDATVEVDYTYSPGSPAVVGGPPECCDPGEGPEIEQLDCTLDDQPFKPSDEQDSAITEWLYANADFDADDYDDEPDWDDLRDRLIDDRLTGDA